MAHESMNMKIERKFTPYLHLVIASENGASECYRAGFIISLMERNGLEDGKILTMIRKTEEGYLRCIQDSPCWYIHQ